MQEQIMRHLFMMHFMALTSCCFLHVNEAPPMSPPCSLSTLMRNSSLTEACGERHVSSLSLFRILLLSESHVNKQLHPLRRLEHISGHQNKGKKCPILIHLTSPHRTIVKWRRALGRFQKASSCAPWGWEDGGRDVQFHSHA